MNKKALLLNLPFHRRVIRDYGCPHGVKANYYWPPIDLLMFGAVVRKEASLAYIDAVAGNRSEQHVVTAVQDLRPDAIVTVLSSITLESDLRLLSEMRRVCPGTKIWATGDVVFFGNSDIPGIDYRVRDLTNGNAILDLWKGSAGSGVIEQTTASEFSIGICPHELIRPYSYAMPYSLHSGITSVLTNYGCPFSCTFCNSNRFGFKRRRTDEIIEELLYIQHLGIREVLVRDFTFNMSDADLICDEMIRNRIQLKWSCWTSAALVSKDILRKMKAAGCYLISYGAESGDDVILQKAQRPVLADRLKLAVGMTKAAGIEVQTSFIIGFPGEGRDKTLSFIRDIDPDYLSLNILAPRLGTAMTEATLPEAIGDRTDSLLSSDAALVSFRDAVEKRFFLRPRKLLRYFFLSTKSPFRLMIFLRTGLSLLRRWIRPSRHGS